MISLLFLTSTSFCKEQIVNIDNHTGLQSIINETVYFLLLKKMNSASMIIKQSEKAKFGY